jgi:hypothetical protein
VVIDPVLQHPDHGIIPLQGIANAMPDAGKRSGLLTVKTRDR